MNRIFKFFSCVFLIVASVSSYSNKAANYGDISIQADIVTLNKANNELLLEKNIIIGFGNFTIVGNKALLSYEKKKLTIDGSPASINSEDSQINGNAKRFIIHPNLSLEMLGDAELVEDNNSIYAQKILYQINSND